MVQAALMCGIAGFVDLDGGNAVDAEATARAMAATLQARGPDDAGAWSDGQVALGFRRLAIVDLSPLGHPPMASASRRYTIVFNGEIYNHGELRAELAAAGARFRGRSDTEVVLAAIEAWGFEATLPRLRGMFAIAVWDARERALSLARDRFGEKPLYVGWLRGGRVLAFASELKALRAPRREVAVLQQPDQRVDRAGHPGPARQPQQPLRPVSPARLSVSLACCPRQRRLQRGRASLC